MPYLRSAESCKRPPFPRLVSLVPRHPELPRVSRQPRAASELPRQAPAETPRKLRRPRYPSWLRHRQLKLHPAYAGKGDVPIDAEHAPKLLTVPSSLRVHPWGAPSATMMLLNSRWHGGEGVAPRRDFGHNRLPALLDVVSDVAHHQSVAQRPARTHEPAAHRGLDRLAARRMEHAGAEVHARDDRAARGGGGARARPTGQVEPPPRSCGSVMWKVVPSAGGHSAAIRPPWLVMMR